MWNYSKAGVDIKKIRKIQSKIGKLVSKTHFGFENKNWKVLSGFGHYAGLIEIESKVIALHTDGIGTKIIVAQLMNKFDTLGIDCVAMNVNDIICTGAMPVGFLDYIAMKKPDHYLVTELLKGLTIGAKNSNMAIVGGETAILPDLLNQTEEYSFDLVGTVFGVADKKNLVMGDKITEGDIIIGLESNGLHSNGYSLARKVLFPKYKLKNSHPFLECSIGEELLKPTRIYVKPILDILKAERVSIHGLAHITGGSFSKLSRLNNKVNFNLDEPSQQGGIFKLIQQVGKISLREMYSTFNMGIGFCIVVPKSKVDKLMQVLDKHKLKCHEIGHVTRGTGTVSITILERKHILTG
ncbi:MAG TPA: phosphoribosylformylglycinamidine cyclo-ligase [Nitrososphaeraceae archaeon]|nr:phosphoribosylformylglycinamidine cyclo-ligase [Nitrososphaeraceae archaeon]